MPSKCKITRKSALKMIGRAQKCPFPKSVPCPFQSWQKHCDNCITLRFLQLGEYVGHYEAILPDDACRVSVNKCTKPHDIIPVPRKSPTIQIRKRRCQVASLLKSSPYKAKLEAAATQKNTRTKPSRNRRPKQSNKYRKRCISDDVSNWFCILCSEAHIK